MAACSFVELSKRNTSVHTERWHYIYYADGSEGLYDHDKDLHVMDNGLIFNQEND